MEPPVAIGPEPAVAVSVAEKLMHGASAYVSRHLETLFVLLTALIVIAVFYFLPYKIAFLNLFYLPVMAAAYFLGKRKAMLGSVLGLLSAVLFAYYQPERFGVSGTRIDAFMVLAAWGGFLILATASIGSLQEKVAKGLGETRRLYEELKKGRQAEELKAKVEKTLYTAMDPLVAKLATDGKLRFEKREISVLFASLSNFAAYSDLNPPDVVLEELNRFLSHMEPIVGRFHGHLDKYLGDGVMAEFGAPLDFDQHALMAVVAAVKMQQKVSEVHLQWPLRVGITTGSAVMGILGSQRQAYTALGDTVNVAKRLEEVCGAGQIYIDESTFRTVEPYVLAAKVRDMSSARQLDEEALGRLEEKLRQEGESAEVLFALGKIYLEMHDASTAIRYLGRALALDPASTEIKLAYADANMKQHDFEKIQLKGKTRKLTVYQVTGLKDCWTDPALIPPATAAKYRVAESFLEIPEDMVLAVETLDGTVGHSRVVALLSYALADRLGLDEETKRIILRAGYLQGIGKEAVPQRILNQVGSLTEQESEVLESYVSESVAACKRMGYDDPRLLEIVRHHRETLDGTGYPGHLSGKAVPLGARITAVADIYSALTAWRPYRNAWESSAAVAEIRKGMEKGRYDRQVVQALTDLILPGPSKNAIP